jgi:trans-2-enoyl-CoA reductase
MVTYGGMSRKPVTVPTSQFIFKDITLKGFWLSKWLEEHPVEDRVKMLETLFPLIRKERFKIWMETWKFDQFAEGLTKNFEEYKNRKIVLKME